MKKVLTSLTLFTAVSSFGLAMNANAEASTTSEIDSNKIEIVSTILPDKTQGETKIIAALDEIDNDKANNIDSPTDTPVEKKTEKKAEKKAEKKVEKKVEKKAEKKTEKKVEKKDEKKNTPPPAEEVSNDYVIKQGDTLYDVALEHDTSYVNLMIMNDLETEHVQAGQKIIVNWSEAEFNEKVSEFEAELIRQQELAEQKAEEDRIQ